jgi:hypothetical protein
MDMKTWSYWCSLSWESHRAQKILLILPRSKTIPLYKSEILVTATYIVYNTGNANNSCGSNEQTIAYVTNAHVSVYSGNVQDTDQAPAPLQQGRTDSTEKMGWSKDLEPGCIQFLCQSNYGNKSRVLLHRSISDPLLNSVFSETPYMGLSIIL